MGFGNLFSSDSTTNQPITNDTGGALAAGAAQAVGGKNNQINTGTIQNDSSKNSHNTVNDIGNSIVTVKGSGSINYNTTTNGLTGDDLVAFENQIAGSLNSGNSGGGGSGGGINFGNPTTTPTAAQAALANTGSLQKYGLVVLAILFPVLFGIYWLVKGRKKK